MSETDQGMQYRTLGELLEEKAAKVGETTFFRYKGNTYTYEGLNQRANAVANKLVRMGVSTGDVVCIFLYNQPEYLYTLFALAKIGAIAAPIDTRFSGSALSDILKETETQVLLLDSDTRTTYEEVRDETDIGSEFFVGDSVSHPYRDFEQLLEANESTPPNIDVRGEDIFSITYIQRYETKHPQGVMLPHHSYLNTGWETHQTILNLSQEDCVFTTLPFYSSYPVQMGVVAAMLAEAEFAFEKQFDRQQFWEWIRSYDATIFLYLGRMLSVLLNQSEVEPDNPTAYALGHGFGFDTDEDLIMDFERRFDITVLEAYGVTPTATIATANLPDDRKVGSVGRPLDYVDVKIVDENDWVVPTGEKGEIVVRSNRPNTMIRKFFENPELTVDVCRNQWIHTNDIGYRDEEGYLCFVANKADSIHLGRVGGRISSLEIESVIDSHPDIAESAVLGVSDEMGEEVIKAVVVPEEGTDLSPIDVSKHCEKKLTYHKLPRYIEFRDQLPRTPSGKIRKNQLRGTAISAGVWDRESGYDLNR